MAQIQTTVPTKIAGDTYTGAEFSNVNSTINANATDAEARLLAVAGTSAVVTPEQIIATASQTVFTLANTYATGQNAIAVYQEGLRLFIGTDYAETNSSTITLAAGATVGDELDFYITGITPVVHGVVHERHTSTTSQVAFTLSTPYSLGANHVSVYANGVRLSANDFTETSTTIITVDEARDLGDILDFYIGSSEESTSVTASNVTYLPVGIGAVSRTVRSRLADLPNFNDFPDIQTALDSGHKYIYGPPGTYTPISTLTIPSGVTVVCADDCIIDGNSFSQKTLLFEGTVGPEFDLSVVAGRDDTVVTLTGSPTFSVGDLVHLVSVKNGLSRADAGEYWLGDGTGGLPYAHFAEFNFIAEDLGSNQYRLAKPLIFPGYGINAAGETETNRTASSLKLVTPCQNSKWVGGQFKKDILGTNVITSRWAYNCRVIDARIDRGSVFGDSLRWESSYECVGEGIEHNNDPSLDFVYGTHHAQLNRFRTVGSQDCGFIDLKESFGGQSVDFTYGSDEFVNVRSFCETGRFTRCFEGLTSHPGCYQESWRDNKIIDCFDDGILVRGLEWTAKGNTILSTVDDPDGVSSTPSFGIVISYGGARRSSASGNTIRGFYGSHVVRGSNTLDWEWEEAYIDISDETISDCYAGLVTEFGSSASNDEKRARKQIAFHDNNLSRMGRYIALFDDYSAAVSVCDNELFGDFRYAGAGTFVALVYAGNNCPALIATGNKWHRSKGGNAAMANIYGVFIASINDLTVFPQADWAAQSIVHSNEIAFSDVDGVIEKITSSAGYLQHKYGTNDNEYTIASGSISILPFVSRATYLKIDTEAAASSDNLDQLQPYDNVGFKEGDICYIRAKVTANALVIRDIATSGISIYGFQTPGGSSITTTSSNNIIQCVFTGNHWSIVSADVTT